MKTQKPWQIILGSVWIVGVLYLVMPTTAIPNPPEGSYISQEPADTESIFRKSYFTDLSRDQIMAYYKNEFSYALRLNHPPEEAFSLIRDQTPSSWLEELHRPWKNTLYINGYYPIKATDQIYRNGTHYQAKITVHFLPASLASAITTFTCAMLAFYLLVKEYAKK